MCLLRKLKHTTIFAPNRRNPLIYRVFLVRRTTVSTCTVIPNWSTPWTFRISYPPSQRIFRSLARVAESQLTYTMRSGCMRSIVFKQASSQPFRGGSTTMTSGWSISSEDASVVAFL